MIQPEFLKCFTMFYLWKLIKMFVLIIVHNFIQLPEGVIHIHSQSNHWNSFINDYGFRNHFSHD